ncbi:MAG: DUF1559 domain-containing protein [Gemmataceae bacterium]
MGLALHNYASTHGSLPPAAVTDKNGNALLSWRVLVLPYIEQDSLYREFHLDEPWDSPHNIQLLGRMPTTYEPFRNKEKFQPGMTFYQGFAGNGTPLSEKAAFDQFPNGTNNTILLVEAGEPVPWTKPADVPFDPHSPPPEIGGLSTNDVRVLMADGTVETWTKPVDSTRLRLAITLVSPKSGK